MSRSNISFDLTLFNPTTVMRILLIALVALFGAVLYTTGYDTEFFGSIQMAMTIYLVSLPSHASHCYYY